MVPKTDLIARTQVFGTGYLIAAAHVFDSQRTGIFTIICLPDQRDMVASALELCGQRMGIWQRKHKRIGRLVKDLDRSSTGIC